jgi:microcystin degradation protein MlrC
VEIQASASYVLAKKVIYVESDGPLARQYQKLAYTKIKRPIWPLDAETAPGLIF